MKRKLSALSRQYVTALKNYLKQGPEASLQPARELGRQAAVIGLETLDVIRIHEEAIALLEASRSRDGMINRAEIFFTEAIAPIEQTHRAALKANARLSQLNKTLSQRTVDLATTNRSLKQGIVQRKTVEQALKTSGEHAKKLRRESHRLQKHLQQLTQQILSTQGDKRRTVSRGLQDENAQALPGINARLLALKKEATVNAQSLKKDIARTQRRVDTPVKTIKAVRS